MPTPEQLIGHQIDQLRFVRKIGSGADNEVFLVEHVWLGKQLVLRLPARNNPLWNETMIPHAISNGENGIENVKGSIAYNRQFWERKTRPVRHHWWQFWAAPESQEWGFSSPVLYGLYQSRYLVPLSEPRRLRGELDVDRVLELGARISIDEALGTFKVFCDLLGLCAMVQRTGELPEGYWIRDILPYFASDSVCNAIRKLWLTRKSVDQGDIHNVTDMLAEHRRDHKYPDPANNLVILLAALFNAREIDRDQYFSTLKSSIFRMSIARNEVVQLERMLGLYKSAGANLLGAETIGLAVSNLATILDVLSEPLLEPSKYTKDRPGPFEFRQVNPERAKAFHLTLQEFVVGVNFSEL